VILNETSCAGSAPLGMKMGFSGGISNARSSHRLVIFMTVRRVFRGSFHGPVGPPIEMKISSSRAYDRRTWTAKVVSTLDEVRP
jgi:hypothetical protein